MEYHGGCQMNIIKKIAEKILKNELNELRKKKKYYEDKYFKSEHECCDKHEKLNQKEAELKKARKLLDEQQHMIEDLNKQNEIMLKYYKADEEPSDNIKLSILTNLRIHELEQQVLTEKVLAAQNVNQKIPVILPYYNPLWWR